MKQFENIIKKKFILNKKVDNIIIIYMNVKKISKKIKN